MDFPKNALARYVSSQVLSDLQKKMVFLAGPRQCGKTLFSKTLLKEGGQDHYLSWDDDADRELILRRELPAQCRLIVFDEIHKYLRWRNFLKGIFDKRGIKNLDGMQILVTGSAKLDHYRRGGDSLQGRYHLLRMHPLSIAELAKGLDAEKAMRDLYQYGGFPEPFFSASQEESRRWSREYRTKLVREEISSLEKVSDLSLIETLMLRLPECVASPLSINSLREDLAVSHVTVQRWLKILENIYAIFRLPPFGGPKIRAVKKEMKHYHYDWNVVQEPGARFENLVACHLLKWCHWREDTEGYDMELRYFKDNEKREVDFVILQDRKPTHFIETKLSDKAVSPSLRYLKLKYPNVEAIQLIFDKDVDFVNSDSIRVCQAWRFLKDLI